MKCLLFILLITLVKISENCPDRWALHKINAFAHFGFIGKGEHLESVSIYELDEYQMIEVIKANVSILCDGILKDFPKLTYLTLIEANISKIQPGAFQNLPELTHLSLALNHLTSVERYQFKNLENLQVLYLSKNQIENVEEDAFIDLLHLKKIILDKNKIHEIDSNWFLSNQKISLIDLSFNDISKVQKGAFTLPKRSIVEIRLQKNKVEEVEPFAVTSNGVNEERPYLTLRLDYNNLTDITEDFVKSMNSLHSTLFFDSNIITCFDPKTLRILKNITIELHADKNPLNCDCLIAATNFIEDHELSSEFYFSSTECKLPGLSANQKYIKNVFSYN